jgi:MSHA biogenesis protein MshP
MSAVRIVRGLARARARGVSLLTAVFLLVVLAALSAAIIGVFGAQQGGAVLDVMGVRADQAARSGLEWGLYRQLRVQPAVPSVACFTPATFALPSDSSLAGFFVTVSCSADPNNLAGNTTNRWTITAVACNRAAGCSSTVTDPDYVQRSVQAELN